MSAVQNTQNISRMRELKTLSDRSWHKICFETCVDVLAERELAYRTQVMMCSNRMWVRIPSVVPSVLVQVYFVIIASLASPRG